jgi:hypothetical protein
VSVSVTGSRSYYPLRPTEGADMKVVITGLIARHLNWRHPLGPRTPVGGR